jgi:hypothetical protein
VKLLKERDWSSYEDRKGPAGTSSPLLRSWKAFVIELGVQTNVVLRWIRHLSGPFALPGSRIGENRL